MPASAGAARPQQPQRDVRRALGQRAAAGGGEHARRPRVGLGLGGQQVRGDDAVERAVVGQQPRGAAVQPRALGAEVGLDDLEHHRVDEAALGGVDQVRAGQHLELAARRLGRQARQRRDAADARRVAEHRRRPGDRQRARGEAPDARRDRPRDRAGHGRPDRRRPRDARPANGAARSSSVSSSGLPRVVSKQASTNSGEASMRARTSVATPSADSGGGPQQPRRGRGREPVEQLLLGARLGRPRGDRQQHRQVLDPPRERVEEAQARRVGPVRVVDDHQQRLLGGEVRAQPVEPVERRVRRVVALRHGRAEHRLGQRRRAREQRAPGAPDRRGAARPSKSCRTIPNAKSRSSGAPVALSTRSPASAARARRTRSSAVLPCPAGASSSATDPRAARAAAS